MPNAHQESERIEFSLDNRQVLFLLFSLLVIASFVFLMGFLVGKRSEGLSATQWSNQGVLAANIAGDAQFEDEEVAGADEENFAFEKGVAVNDAAKLPPTRAEGTAPRNENEVRAERYKEDRKAVQATQPKTESGVPAPFTLQIRRFQDKAAADLLRQRILRKGFGAKIQKSTTGEFVVTVGEYLSWKDALAAKSAFEAKVGLVAYAARQ